MLVALIALFGLLIGSFLNVVIARVPVGASVVSPPSACPGCGAGIRPRDNVPVLSWLILRGRCRDCDEPISGRYPLIELVTALVFAATAWWFLPDPLNASGIVVTLAYLYLAAACIALFAIDLELHRLPDKIVLPSIAVVGLMLTLAAALDGSWGSLGRALLCGVILFVLYFVMLVAYPSGMGFGDVKLAAVLGMALGWLGWGPFVIGAFSAFLLGGLFSIALLVIGRAGRKTGIAFGPWMILGAAVGIAAGNPLWDAYLTLLN